MTPSPAFCYADPARKGQAPMNSEPTSRREFLQTSAALAASGLAPLAAAEEPQAISHPFLTPAADFYDVSRGVPKPHTLTGTALATARLTPETWRLEVVADPFTSEVVKEPAGLGRSLTIADGTALDLKALISLGEKHRVRFVKAMQCLNIAEPLGQGLWEGVPLREVLRLCGPLTNVRRIYYRGFHNHDPAQLFQSSLSYTEAMETPPGELPAFLAWKLNGEAISLERGGPVRMIIPWAHGFKSIKWLQQISVTNDYRANDTYAEKNNDPDSHLKTAAYIDHSSDRYKSGRTVKITGRVISGLSGLRRVEGWLHRVDPATPEPAEENAPWKTCDLEAPPTDWSTLLPAGVSSRDVLGFDPESGQPLSWPLRYSMITWSATLKDLKPGHYEFRARAIDLNGYAQPEPRPVPKTGKNAVEVHRFEVT